MKYYTIDAYKIYRKVQLLEEATAYFNKLIATHNHVKLAEVTEENGYYCTKSLRVHYR